LLAIGQTDKGSWFDLSASKPREKTVKVECPGQIGRFIIAPDGQRLLAYCFLPGQQVSQLFAGECGDDRIVIKRELKTSYAGSYYCAFSPDSTLVAVAGEETSVKPAPKQEAPDVAVHGTIRIWDVSGTAPRETSQVIHTGDHRAQLPRKRAFQRIGQCMFSPNGKELMVGVDDTFFELWQLGDEPAKLGSFREPRMEDAVWPFAVSQDGTNMVVGLRIFDRSDAAKAVVSVRKLSAPDFLELKSEWPGDLTVRQVDISLDGRLALAQGTVELRVWEIATGKVVYSHTFDGALSQSVFAPDSRHVLVRAGGKFTYVLRLPGLTK
jgi:hypothetical protein